MKNQSGFAPIQIIFSILAGTIILGGVVGGVLYFAKQPNLQIQQSRCGDGVCDAVEKAHPDLCPKDCAGEQPVPSVPPTTTPKTENAVSVESSSVESPFGFIQGDYANAIDLGVHWNRPYEISAGTAWSKVETKKGVYDFTNLDKTFSEASKNGINILLSLSTDNEFYGSSMGGNPYPTDMEAFKNYVKAMVERYDGDGKNDFSSSGYLEAWPPSG